MSFLAYTGSGDALAGLASRTLSFGDAASDPASLLNNGWTRVSDYADAGNGGAIPDRRRGVTLLAGVDLRADVGDLQPSVGNDYVKLAAIEGFSICVRCRCRRPGGCWCPVCSGFTACAAAGSDAVAVPAAVEAAGFGGRKTDAGNPGGRFRQKMP